MEIRKCPRTVSLEKEKVKRKGVARLKQLLLGSAPTQLTNLRLPHRPGQGCARPEQPNLPPDPHRRCNRAPPAHLPVLRLRLPRAFSRSAPPPASNLAPTEVALEDVLRILTSAWRGVAGVQERGGTSCPARAELPSEPENSLPRVV